MYIPYSVEPVENNRVAPPERINPTHFEHKKLKKKDDKL